MAARCDHSKSDATWAGNPAGKPAFFTKVLTRHAKTVEPAASSAAPVIRRLCPPATLSSRAKRGISFCEKTCLSNCRKHAGRASPPCCQNPELFRLSPILCCQILKLCDFGFGAHSLTVGTNECLPVTISNLRVVLGSPTNLKVILNACGYGEHFLRTGCPLYLRAVDAEGKPMPDVDLSSRILTNERARTDSYGRYQTLFGGTTDVMFSKPGFQTETVHLQCHDTEDIEKELVLKKAANR